MSEPDQEPAREPARRRTQVERRQDAEERLVASAIDLIGRKGVRALTLSEVGECAGYSRGLVTHHYGSREAFLGVVAQHLRQRFVDSEQVFQREPGLAALLASVEIYLTGRHAIGRAMNVMLTEGMVSGGKLLENMREFTQTSRTFFAHHIRLGMERGEIRSDIDADAHAVMILGLLRGVASQVLLDPERVQVEALLPDVLAGVRRMLVP
jgi:AcrR family transcriptional regulator